MTRFRYAVLLSTILVSISSTCRAQKARAYFDELYKAGGLDRMADQYVCFDEKPENENFFIFAKSDTLKEFLKENNGLESLPAESRTQLEKGF